MACARPSTPGGRFSFSEAGPRQVGWVTRSVSSVGTGSVRRSWPRPWPSCGRPASTSTPSTTTWAASATCAPARSCPTRSSTSCATSTPSSWGGRSPQVTPGVLERGLLLRLRFELDLYVNLRPFRAANIDAIVVRENTEGVYAGEGGVLRKGTPHEIATQGSVNTRRGVERCVRFAFALAEARPPPPHPGPQDQRPRLRRRPLAAHLRRARRRAPRRHHAYCHVDAACIHLVENWPASTSSSPTTSSATSSPTWPARSPGASAWPLGQPQPRPHGPSLFEPVHGSAPDIAGTGTANPLAAIKS